MKKQEIKKKKVKLWAEFKAFVSKGNVLDMAIGVIMGSAFGAIVTALVNILISVCTWAVPGGIKGLVTVLPAVNSSQSGLEGIGQTFDAAKLNEIISTYAKASGFDPKDAAAFGNAQNAILSKYTLHGSTYYYNGSAIIDWGTFINAIISFLIIALVLFIILKVFSILKAKRLELEAKEKEAYYKKHPEERPVAGKPVDTPEVALLKEIRDTLKANQQK